METSDSKPVRSERRLRRTLGSLAIGAIGGALLVAWFPRAEPPHNVVLRGADISRHGGRTIVIASGHALYRQTCADACDDASILIDPLNQEFEIRILDERGKCIFCEKQYADNSGKYIYTVSGVDKLSVGTNLTYPR